MDWGLFFQAAGVGVAVFGVIIGAFYWLWAQISRIRDEAALRAEAAHAVASSTKEELHQHRLYTAETYATKTGMETQTAQIMTAIGGLGERLEGLNRRLDRVFESRRDPPRD